MALQETQAGQFPNLFLIDGGRKLEIELFQPLHVRKPGQLRAHFEVALLPGLRLAYREDEAKKKQQAEVQAEQG